MFVTNLLLLEKKHHSFSVLYQLNQWFYEMSDSFFPQMKPEVFGKKGPELNENEQLVFDILSKENKMDLNELKSQAGLSNKQWDKSIKGLAKHGLTKVAKTDEGLFVEVV